MPPIESRSMPAGRGALAWSCLLVGSALILASLFLPKTLLHSGAWSREQAEKYQAASVKLHSLANSRPSETQAEQFRHELKQAEQQYEALRTELDSTIARPAKITWILRGLGVALLLAGAAAAKAAPSRV